MKPHLPAIHRQNFLPWLVGFLLLVIIASTASPSVASTTGVSGSGIDFAAIDAYITAQMDKHGLQGISLAITQGDQVAYLKGYGTAGQGRPMTPQTPMYIGSQSKSVTGLAIAQLVVEGKVDLNAPVQKYIPWFSVADPDASQKITIGQLIHHTSGLSEEGYTTVLVDDTSLEDAVRSLSTAVLSAAPGTKFQYFNLDYCVLSLIIEKVTGQKYADYIQQNIFTPLQMGRTYTDPDTARANGLSQGFSRFFGFAVPAPQPHPAYQLGDGYIISTAEDMAHYAIAMLNRGSYQGTSVISPDNAAMLFEPVLGYGIGWFIQPGHINHGGANETFKTYVDLYPARGLGIVLLINQGYMMDHFISADQVFGGVYAIATGKTPPGVSDGWSVRLIGYGLLALVLGLCVLHTWNFYQLRTWIERARRMSKAKLAFDVAISFIIPTVILVLVYTQVKSFFGYRFNLTYQILMMFKTLPDIAILMLVGSVPDYVQGFIKLYWVLAGKVRHQEKMARNISPIIPAAD